MLLKIRNGKRLIEVHVPAGCRVERSVRGRSVLLIPGRKPTDTCTWLPASEVLQAAQQGLYGLVLRSDRSEIRPRLHALNSQFSVG
ncbi:hypothetical protein BH23PLA1_BH23PLA1_22270 [soil metagenome]